MIEAFVAALFGLLIGSFLNVCIYRLPLDLSVARPARSFCPHCEHTIAWYDNIPLVSWLRLRGRCRHCGGTISWRYPIVEALTAAAFFACVAVWGLTLPALKYAIFSALTLGLLFTDLEERILPDEFTLGGTAIGFALAWFVWLPAYLPSLLLGAAGVSLSAAQASLIEAAFASVFLGFLLWLLGWVYEKVRHREGLGLGDVKMIAMIGAFLGLPGAMVALTAGSLAGSIVGLLFIRLTGKDASTYEIPFGTFLAAGGLLAAAVVR